MSEVSWARGPGDSHRVPDFDRSRSWKERPIDVRAEAAAQVGPQRRGEVIARRIEEWREQRVAAEAAEAPRCCLPCDARTGEARATVSKGVREPEVRRRRKRDPYFPSSRYLWRGDKGKAYVRAWQNYSWGLGERPKPWAEFDEAKTPTRRRLKIGRRKSR